MTTLSPTTSLIEDNQNNVTRPIRPGDKKAVREQYYNKIGVLSHGTITFPNNRARRAEFIRVRPEANVKLIKELPAKLWGSERPSFVISVTGGAKEYNMKPKLLRAFRRGLRKVARTSGAWIITGGMNTGIMKLVGEIVQINPDRSRPIHLIGIASWGCVAGFEQLQVEDENVNYMEPRRDSRGQAPLEPNHTEFIFVDDNSRNKYGGEIDFRAKLTQAISNGFFAFPHPVTVNQLYTNLQPLRSIRSDSAQPVPVVLLVVEGGRRTLKTVHESVVRNNIPAVFLGGTGRCCDLFAKAYRLYKKKFYSKNESNNESSSIDPINFDEVHAEFKDELREKVKDELDRTLESSGENNRDEIDTTDYFDLVYQCLQKQFKFLNIITLNPRNPIEPDIDLVILHALLNATSNNDTSRTNIQRKHEQLRLALEWKRVDIAKNYIMKSDRDWEGINLNDLFLLALEHDQVEFVELFLNHDFSLTDLFQNRLEFRQIYRHYLKKFDNVTRDSNDVLRTIYEKIIQPYIGDCFEVDAALQTELTASHTSINENNNQTSCFSCGSKQNQNESSSRHSSSRSEQPVPLTTRTTHSLIDADKELFLWSILTGKQEFALLFWSRGKNKICAALIATAIYRKQAQKGINSNYYQYAEEFENLAVEILNKFYQTDPSLCKKAMIRQSPIYGNVTWLDVAIVADAKEFIAQKPVQNVLNTIWYGSIDRNVSDFEILYSTIILWNSGFLCYNKELIRTNHVENLNNQSLEDRQTTTTTTTNNDVHMPFIENRLDVEDNIFVKHSRPSFFKHPCTTIYLHFDNILKFMRAPYVKYLYNLYFHVIFLLLFSYVILCDLFPLYNFSEDVCAPAKEEIDHQDHDNTYKSITNLILHKNQSNTKKSVLYGFQQHHQPAITELILILWVFTLFCEEIREICSVEAQSIRKQMRGYLKVFWNRLDMIAIILFFLGIILRFLPLTECYCAARIILSIDLTLWFIRSLDIFSAIRRLGPKLIMIGEMVHDLYFFMLMLTVFILAFGVSSYSLIYGVQQFSWHIPRRILNLAYWQIFGEINALNALDDNYNANGYAVFILLVAYMALVSILLVNLLIAMFSFTFNRLHTDTDRISKFQRYSLVCEYLSRPSLPPPFILLSHLRRLILFIFARGFKLQCMQQIYQRHLNRTKYKIEVNKIETTTIEIDEDALGDEVYYNHPKFGRKLVDETDLDEERIQAPQENISHRMRILENQIQVLTNQQSHLIEYLYRVMDRTGVSDERRCDSEDPLNTEGK